MSIGIFDGIERFSDRIAFIGEGDAQTSYAQLAAKADAFAARIGDAPQLLIIEAENDLTSMVALVGALRGRHPIILSAPDRAKSLGLAALFGARHIISGGEIEAFEGQVTALHPDLAVLLSTSGSTGATKLVRLSHANIAANAASIADYLAISPDDRAITTLAPHYSYGLSVLTSHLSVGATIILNPHSVIDPGFRQLCNLHKVTSIAGVPHSYELLDRSGFRKWVPASLKSMTQAGGRLAPELALRFGEWMASRGGKFCVMYGQTEATARIAYMPPEMLADNPGCIGRAIPGGALTLIDADGNSVDDTEIEGELVYRGPNVMMGYAQEALDLGCGAEIERLETGDLAVRQSNGLFRITGRKSRFVKPFGLRVSLDQIEQILRAKGVVAAVAGDDNLIAVALEGNEDIEVVKRQLAAELNFPESLFLVSSVDHLPLLDNDKTDYRAILAQAKFRNADADQNLRDRGFLPLFQAAFPSKHLTKANSFVDLAGDSLNYVLLAAEIEDRIGKLPDGWEAMPVSALDALAKAPKDRQTGWLRSVDSEIVLRALAICAVVANHASDWPVGGGVDALLVLVGFNLARFQFDRFVSGHFWQAVVRLAARILIPYYILLAVYAVLIKPVSLSSWLLISNFEGRFGNLLEPYWFIEAFFQCLLLFVLIGLIPPIRRFAKGNPFGFGMLLLLTAVVTKILDARFAGNIHLLNRTPDEVFIFIALGWSIYFARTNAARAAMLAFAVLLGLASFQMVNQDWWHAVGNGYRGLWVVLASALLLYVRRLPVPAPLRSLAVTLSAASFTIYMVHNIPINILQTRLHFDRPLITILIAIAVGFAVHAAVTRLSALITRVVRR